MGPKIGRQKINKKEKNSYLCDSGFNTLMLYQLGHHGSAHNQQQNKKYNKSFYNTNQKKNLIVNKSMKAQT